MNSTEFRIIDAMSREIGNPISISGLTTEIKGRYGSAYYPNIYNSLMSLGKEDVIQIEKQGKASIPLLNFSNYLLPDMLIEMELQKKREFLEKWPEAQLLFASIDSSFGGLSFIKSIILINPTRNMKLNRAELLFIIDEGDENKLEKTDDLMREMKKRHYIRIEYLIMTESEIINALKSPERDPIKEMLSNKIALHLAQNFWMSIRNAYLHGMRIKFETKDTNPAKISAADLTYNLARLGYRELGPEIRQEQEISIEYVIASILLNEDKRRMAAGPIILAKNKADYGLLAFLSQRYGFAERLLGLLIALNNLTPSKELQRAMTLLKEAGTRPIKLDESHMKDSMLLYGIGAK